MDGGTRSDTRSGRPHCCAALLHSSRPAAEQFYQLGGSQGAEAGSITFMAGLLCFHCTAQVAVFDTTYHATMPPEAFTYALPAPWRQRIASAATVRAPG